MFFYDLNSVVTFACSNTKMHNVMSAGLIKSVNNMLLFYYMYSAKKQLNVFKIYHKKLEKRRESKLLLSSTCIASLLFLQSAIQIRQRMWFSCVN